MEFTDRIGRHLELGSTVLTCEHGRIIVAQVIKFGKDNVTVKALDCEAWDKPKPFRRDPKNVYIIPESHITLAKLSARL